ncbi:protein kinase [Gordonia sp. zg691]|uniref:serine/threonine-protein kinase n=1 Tax=Gordonia jinghuaiqii TaxID=2758710 RepID=UPI0016625781|nr:serine/threonine-protein kinase [Gordonia jinghuaiqii]MBD0861094.1 protein kinase [Gordonia jinghuaiqii]
MYQVGDLIAGYRVLDVLGRGGMGEVYKAAHPRLPRADALKVLRSVHAADPVFRARFEREANIVAPLHHPNIVTVYDRGIFEGLLWIAMEYVPGTDAARMLAAEAPLDPRLACTIITGVAAGLDAAHRRGVMHRDIKPANILVTPGDSGVVPEAIKVTDFGIAQVLDEVTNLTGTGITIGTMRYASPEQIEGRRVDGRADIYSLGATAYELLTGAPPFDSSSLHGLMTAHMYHEPPAASGRNGALPSGVDPVLARAIAKDPARRYPSAGEFALALVEAFDTRATLIGPGLQPGAGSQPVARPPAPLPPAPHHAAPPAPHHATPSMPSTPSSAVRAGAAVPRDVRLGPPLGTSEPLRAWVSGETGVPTGPAPRRLPAGGRLLAAGAAVVLFAGILGAGAGFIRTSAAALDAPDPPDAEVSTSAVELNWNAVADATTYVVAQNDEVIYRGPATAFTAPRPVPGQYTYQVAAHAADGRTSEFSRNSEAVEVFMTWDELTPIVDLYHDLIPATPLSTNGFDGMRCWGEDGDLAFVSSKRTISCTRFVDDDSEVASYRVIVDHYDSPAEAKAAATTASYGARGAGHITAQGHAGTLYLSDREGGEGQAILAYDAGDRARSVVFVTVPGQPSSAAADALKRLPI